VGSRQIISDEYIAGFLDGDGSIVATLEKYKSSKFPYRVRLKLNFTQHIRHRKFIKYIYLALNKVGAIREAKKHNMVELVIQERRQLKQVLVRLSPYLVLKKKQAEIALAILEFLSKNKKHQPSILSNREYTRILRNVCKIRSLNSNTGGKRMNL